jgi:8-amino-7-oxononanoate synthase
MRHASVIRRLENEAQSRLYRELSESGANIYFRTACRSATGQVLVDGRPCLMLGSNDYLGLRFDPRVQRAAAQAAERYGSGAGGSRLLAGSVPLHRELEEQLADWVEREDALLFTTGYQANLGTLSALLRVGDTVLCDAGIHASLLDGCRLAGARIQRFRRHRMRTLASQLAAAGAQPEVLVMDAVYSMEGDEGPLDAVAAELGEGTCCFLLDEAHALGVYGPTGGGLATTRAGGRRVDLVTGTLSKSLASCGGFVAGERRAIEAIRANARSLIFSTASVPAALGAARAALEIARSEPEHRERVLENTALLRSGLRSAGVDTGRSTSPIVPAIIGDPKLAFAVSQQLFQAGIYAGIAIHPAVPKGSELVRFSVTAALSPSEIQQVVDVTSKIMRNLGVVGR